MPAETPRTKACSYLSNGPALPRIPHPRLDQPHPQPLTPPTRRGTLLLPASTLPYGARAGGGRRAGFRVGVAHFSPNPICKDHQGDGCVREDRAEGTSPSAPLRLSARSFPHHSPGCSAALASPCRPGSVTPSPLLQRWITSSWAGRSLSCPAESLPVPSLPPAFFLQSFSRLSGLLRGPGRGSRGRQAAPLGAIPATAGSCLHQLHDLGRSHLTPPHSVFSCIKQGEDNGILLRIRDN